MLERARRRFYNAGGPWYRCRLFEAVGSERYSHPALFGMDRRLAELMPWEGGTFVEAGAHDGFTQSNTYYLERHRGWSGLLVEPIPELRERCERRRRGSSVVGCALVGPGFQAPTIDMQFGDLMSVAGDHRHAAYGLSVSGRSSYSVSVPARTLSSVLDDAGLTNVDLLVLDVEGHEADALAGLDLRRHSPRYILLEALDRASQEPQLTRILADHYDLLQPLSEYDLLYRRRDT
jgi:FkbM family methyltransferase